MSGAYSICKNGFLIRIHARAPCLPEQGLIESSAGQVESKTAGRVEIGLKQRHLLGPTAEDSRAFDPGAFEKSWHSVEGTQGTPSVRRQMLARTEFLKTGLLDERDTCAL